MSVCAIVDGVHRGHVSNASLFNEPFGRRFQLVEQGVDLVFGQLVAEKSYFNSVHLMPFVMSETARRSLVFVGPPAQASSMMFQSVSS